MTLLSKPTALAITLAALSTPLIHAEEFSFDSFRAKARALAAEPYKARPITLADAWKNLTYDEHRDIRFKMESGLWWDKKAPFSVDFFHPGWTACKTVNVSEVTGGQAKPVAFDQKLFDYGKTKVPADTPPPPGYSGWRARTHLNSKDYMDEFLVFLGASYFRAIPAHASYGASARGLSINSGLPGVGEEFPDFTDFYLQRPANDDKSLKFWAMLNGESVAGAYQFTVTPGKETVVDIEAEITLRKPVTQLGLVPFSSMFWFGENTHPRPFDFRPEIHDSDGVQMELGSGNLHYRPLEHTENQFRHCVFRLEKPRSWSLLQRDRSFASYQDAEAGYHIRPSVRVEPVSGFDLGKLHLIEMPTPDETNDNVILVWEPEPMFEVGKPYHIHYRLIWQENEKPTGKFLVKATRTGLPVKRPNQVLMAVDFAKPLLPTDKTPDLSWDDISKVKPVVTLNNKDVKLVHVGLSDLSMANVDDLAIPNGRDPKVHMPQVLRAFFVMEPPAGTDNLDMTCELHDKDGKVISERWIYLWRRTH